LSPGAAVVDVKALGLAPGYRVVALKKIEKRGSKIIQRKKTEKMKTLIRASASANDCTDRALVE
jgi:hypothetical protein